MAQRRQNAEFADTKHLTYGGKKTA